MIDLEKFNFNPEDTILFRYPYEGIDIITLKEMFDLVKEHFNDNTVVAMPDKVSLEAMSKEEYEYIISHLRSGKWIDKDYGILGYCCATCSRCKFRNAVKGVDTGWGHDYIMPKYCENCGSRNN